ncbi:helix-turn-helix transcriptional regulator [bacterium SCSIO 12741]|nr:helix-turn-helix transcriptional regulator [bacterium SCSIO 12741]
MDLALAIRILREYKHFTQEYVAIQLGVSQKVYSNLENGVTRIQATTFYEISRVLGFSMDEIVRFSREGNKVRPDQLNPISNPAETEIKMLYQRLENLEQELKQLKGN